MRAHPHSSVTRCMPCARIACSPSGIAKPQARKPPPLAETFHQRATCFATLRDTCPPYPVAQHQGTTALATTIGDVVRAALARLNRRPDQSQYRTLRGKYAADGCPARSY